ncbi:MAG: putative cytokinetic ring protein SteA [Mycobacteriales bacterium]
MRLATPRRWSAVTTIDGGRDREQPATPGDVAAPAADAVVAVGPARLGRSTKELTRRLRPGDVAVLDHPELDRVSAEALRSRGVVAVVNATSSVSDRYPNEGPAILTAAGIPLLDGVGEGVFTTLHDGDAVALYADGGLRAAGRGIGAGQLHSTESVAAGQQTGRAALGAELEAFAANTMDFLRRERDMLLAGVGPPRLRTPISGRQALVVVRGYDYKEDLASLRPYIRDYRPVLIGVDGGADALLEAGCKPDIVIGDMDSVSDQALSCGAELVVHAYPDGQAPGLARLAALGLSERAACFPTMGTSEDAALLLADALGAELIVAVGGHATLVEFLDKGRAGMASTFLTRLRVGATLVDAKGVSRLYRSRISTWSLVALVLATLVTFAAALGVSEAGRTYLLLVLGRWHDFVHWLVH